VPVMPPTIAKLIPRLASDHDGEVLATVAAIRRTLASQKLDLHDLAKSIGGIPHTSYSHHQSRQSTEPPHKKEAEYCLSSGYSWRENEKTFLTDMKFRPNALTEKQRAWLDALIGKARAYEELHK
jgi:hypothetical protein